MRDAEKLKMENVRCRTVLNFEIFYHQIIANLPYNATEIENFSNTHEILGFFEKRRWVVFERKP